MNSELRIGDCAPDFEASVTGGGYGNRRLLKLSSLRGRRVVLYFYPKDDTPGCTAQACGLRDGWDSLRSTGAEVIGVSVDGPESHARFSAKHDLPFGLASDESREIVQAYGVWVEKSMYGKKYWGTERTTFIIGVDGRIEHIHRKIQPAAHLAAVLKALR